MRKDAHSYRLKAAAADLIVRVGGQKRAGEIVGVSQQMMSNVAQRDSGAMLTIAGKLALERECGTPLLTQVEADLLGYQLVPITERPVVPGNPYSAQAALVVEVGELLNNFGQRVRDGDFSRADAASIDRDLADIIRKAEAFRLLIAAQLAGEAE